MWYLGERSPVFLFLHDTPIFGVHHFPELHLLKEKKFILTTSSLPVEMWESCIYCSCVSLLGVSTVVPGNLMLSLYSKVQCSSGSAWHSSGQEFVHGSATRQAWALLLWSLHPTLTLAGDYFSQIQKKT
jgi:hypothetical protein